MADHHISDKKRTYESVCIGGLIIRLCTELHSCELTWLKIEKLGFSTFSQSHVWCNSWVNTIGASLGVKPIVIIGSDTTGQTAFVLPLQLRRRFGLDVLEWLAQSDNNYGMGLFDTKRIDVNWFDQHFADLLRLLPKFDVLNLQNMPRSLGGVQNPLASVLRFKAANNSYAMALTGNYDVLHKRKRSAKSIGKIRRRDSRLDELGAVTFERGQTSDSMRNRLEEVLHDKNLQLNQRGIGSIFDAGQHAFIRGMIEPDTLPGDGLQVYRLALDGKTLSTIVGAIHASGFDLLIAALAPDSPKQFSPGDLLLRRVIEDCCEIGLERFDFGKGVDDYKLLWADEEILLYNLFEAITLKGLPYAGALLAFNSLKRMIKNSKRTRNFFFKLRQRVRGH